uniref:Uncharacterized protein n=1 Tax=Zea mays TaxID=4577 RepID=A0A804PUR9_MAIZE
MTLGGWLLAHVGGGGGDVGGVRGALEELLPEHVVEAVEEPLLDGVHGPLEAVEQLGGVLVVHEEAVVQVEAVAAGVVHEADQRLVPPGVDGRGAQLQRGQHPPDGVRQELGLGGVRVVLGAGHLHHPAPLALEGAEERVGAGAARGAVPDAHPLEHQRQAVPPVARRLRPEHGVRADHVEAGRQRAQEQVPGELLHGEHVREEGAAAEPVQGQRPQHGLRGQDGGGEQHHVRVALAQVVRVGEEGGAQRGRRRRVVRPRVRQQRVPLPRERARQELPEVAEPHDGDLQPLPLLQRPRRAGLVVERLGGVQRAEGRRGVPAPPPRGGQVGGASRGRSRRVGAGWLVEA